MEAGDHFKNGESLKGLRSRGKKILLLIVLIMGSMGIAQGQTADEMVQKGHAYYKQENYSDAKYWFEKAAAQENPQATRFLGLSYYHGNGVEKNHETAKSYFKKTIEILESGKYKQYGESYNAELFYTEFYLGECYSHGNDAAQAIYWYKRAATKGLWAGKVSLELGVLYDLGTHEGKDGNVALCYYEKALDHKSDLSEMEIYVAETYSKRLKEEGYSSSRAKIQSQSSSVAPAKPSGKIEKIWLEHNTYNNGEKGMNIHCYFSIDGMKGKRAFLCAFIRDSNDKSVAFQCNGSSNGGSIIPPYDSSEYKDFVIFKSYSDSSFLSLPRGKTELNVHVRLIDDEILDESDYVHFTYTR
jgi:hypothetical protein